MSNLHPPSRRGFTMLEFLVGLAIVVILAGTVVPYAVSARERERRARCMDNLRKIGLAMSHYASDNQYELPRVVYDAATAGYTAYTGADDNDPFASGSAVSPNDVSASLWLLVRGNYISSEFSPASGAFICPSTSDDADPITAADGSAVGTFRRSNFRSPQHLSYSYASPFSAAPGYGLKTDFIERGFALLADMNPGTVDEQQDAAGADHSDDPRALSAANSLNHRRAGQNVLFGDMHVEFTSTPYCGVDGDNIYTAAVDTGDAAATSQRPVRGRAARKVAPADAADSFLVPTAND